METDVNIREQLASLQRDTGRIEGKLDSFIAVIATNDKDISSVETRVRQVENKQAFHTGVGAVLGAIGGFLTNLFAFHLH